MKYHIECCVAEIALCGANIDIDLMYPRLCNRCLDKESKGNYCPLVPHDCEGWRTGKYAKEK